MTIPFQPTFTENYSMQILWSICISDFTKGQIISKGCVCVIVWTKTPTIILRISALVSKKSSNQKTFYIITRNPASRASKPARLVAMYIAVAKYVNRVTSEVAVSLLPEVVTQIWLDPLRGFWGCWETFIKHFVP